jgi:hypothetical protein
LTNFLNLKIIWERDVRDVPVWKAHSCNKYHRLVSLF